MTEIVWIVIAAEPEWAPGEVVLIRCTPEMKPKQVWAAGNGGWLPMSADRRLYQVFDSVEAALAVADEHASDPL